MLQFFRQLSSTLGKKDVPSGLKRASKHLDAFSNYLEPLSILLPVSERAKQLFGEDGASAVATRIEQEARRNPQMTLDFMLPEPDAPTIKGRSRSKKGKAKSLKEVSDDALAARREATTLDRVHAAMLLQSGGRANALRALLKAEQERGSDFFRLADALSALYPKDSEEKRLLDAMLLAVPR